jgi:peptide chain release factor 2
LIADCAAVRDFPRISVPDIKKGLMILLQYEELRQTMEGMRPELSELGEALGLDTARSEVSELEQTAAEQGFWDDMEKSQKILQKLGALKAKIEGYDKLKKEFSDTLELISMADEEGDESFLPEVRDSCAGIRSKMDEMKLSTLLTGEYDAKNAILTFHAGAGGTEAQDWAEMLYRMYTRWGERHGFKVSVLDYLDGEEAGLKSASILLEGANAYGYLRSEIGVHRLVRISPFDASGRRHTSFASLEVMPEIDEDVKVDINPEDLKIDTYRSSGAGGQHINKTSSAVRITHIPTGIVAACQNERSQYQNKDMAMRMLRSKLMEIKEREHLEKIEDIKGVQKEIAWGSQIRSYVFMPYTLVKDHRTGFETGNINAVMDGDLDGFINAYLKADSLGKLADAQ